jgi:type IV secretion system protein VirB4
MDAVSLALGSVLGAGLASLIGRSREDRATPIGLADVLQWGFLADGPERAVILNKDGALLAGWRYHGPDTGTASDAELESIARQVNDALLPFGDGWCWHVDAIRRPAEPYPASAFPPIRMDVPDVSVPAWIDAERRAAFAAQAGGAHAGAADAARPGVTPRGPGAAPVGRRAEDVARGQYVSEFTFTLTYLPPPDTHARAARLFVQRGDADGARTSPAQAWHAVLTYFTEQVAVIDQRLGGRFHLARLDAAQLVAHLHECLTTLGHPVAPPPIGAYLNTVLASQEFVSGFVPRIGARHLVVIAVEDYPDDRPGAGRVRLDFLNMLAVPYRWSSRFIPLSQRTADKVLKQQRQSWFAKRRDLGAFMRELMSSKDQSDYKRQEEEDLFGNQDARTMLKDVNAAMAENSSGVVRYGFSTQVVVVAHEDRAMAEGYAAAIVERLHQEGFTARRETVNAPEAFFGSLPGHGYPNLRRQPLHSANLADLWPLTSVWPGQAHNPSQLFPPQSPPLMRVATDGSTGFRFNLHVGDVGHTLVVGSTGGGKSTLLGLVQAQWQRYVPSLGAQTIVFDYDYSHWLLTKACGARHYDLCAGRADAVAFQPLADVDEPSERAWAGSWLEVFLTIQGVAVTPARRTVIARALALLGEQHRAHRTLSEFVIQLQDPELREAFRPYLAGGTYGQLFDAAEESVGEGAWQVYELKHLLGLGEQVVTPAFLYLAHRVERQLTGRPTLVVIEEIHALLGKAEFPELLRRWLLTMRKRNAAVVMVFHTPAQLEQLPAKQIVVESCLTRILLPNPQAASEDNARLYRELGVNDAEIRDGVVRAAPKRDYYVSSPLGGRKISLELGPVTSAFLGTPAGLTPQAVQAEVRALEARVGAAWPAHWLARLGRAIPAGAAIAAPAPDAPTSAGPTPGAGAIETMAGVPLWREHVTDEATAGTPARRSTLAAPGAPAGGSLAGVTYSAEESDGDAWDTSALGRG